MINIVDHTTEVIKAEVPLIVKIIIFLIIIAITRLNKSNKETKKAKPRIKPNEEDVFAKMQQAVGGDFWDNFDENEPAEDELEKKFNTFNETQSKETSRTETAFNTQKTKEYVNPEFANFKNQERTKREAMSPFSKDNTSKKEEKSISKKRVKFDLKQAVIAETVLNRKYS